MPRAAPRARWAGLALGALALLAACSHPPAPPAATGLSPTPPPAAADQVGAGPAFVLPESIRPDRDGRLLVVDATGGALFSVEARTGARERLYPVEDVPVRERPRDAVRAPDGTLFLLLEGDDESRIVQLDAEGRMRDVSGPDLGEGPSWDRPFRIDVLDEGHLVVNDVEEDAFFSVEIPTGKRVLLSGDGRGRGPGFAGLNDFVVAPGGDLLAVDEGRNQVLRVDPKTGDRAVAADLAHPAGPAVMAPAGIGLGEPGRVLVTEPDFSRVFEVDLATGVQKVLAAGTSPGVPLLVPMDAVRLPDGAVAVTCSRGPNVVLLEADGRRVLSGSDSAREGQQVAPSAALADPGGAIWFTDPTVPGVGLFDPATGALRWVSGPGRGKGPDFRSPTGLARTEDGGLFVSDRRVGLVRVDPETGDRRVVLPDGEAREDSPSRLRDVETLPGLAEVLVIAYKPREVFRVDPASGKVAPIHPEPVPGTPPLEEANRLARSGKPGEALVGSSLERSVFRLDPDRGRLELVTGPGKGSGPLSSMQDSMAVTSDGILYIGNSMEGNVLKVGPTGDRALVSGRDLREQRGRREWALVGEGPRPLQVRDLVALPSDRLLIADPTVGGFLELDPATGNRRRLEIKREP